jgi:hypothetical protein
MSSGGGSAGGAAAEEVAAEAGRTIERGHLHFLYRPKVDSKEVKTMRDVQRFLMIMEPVPVGAAAPAPAAAAEAEAAAAAGPAPAAGTGSGQTDSEREQAERAKTRLIIIGKKRLPDAARHERFFGFVGAWTRRRSPFCQTWCAARMHVWDGTG